jgi:hypothetical protein
MSQHFCVDFGLSFGLIRAVFNSHYECLRKFVLPVTRSSEQVVPF